ncbi:MAG TPA: protein jag [Dehalococcoidia bacterium]|nr:protein jag [Dehalococcoidia bacterium]
MGSLEISAKTVDEAIQSALKELGVSREEIEVTVLKEGRPGIWGLGSEEARIKVTPRKGDNIAEATRSVLEKLLTMMGVNADVHQDIPSGEGMEETAPIAFDIKGEDLGILIGRRGLTLSCLQYIVRLIVAHQIKSRVPITIDVEGYKQRRDEALQTLAWRVAEQVKAKGTPFRLEPMSAYERRIIHLTLANHPDVTTEGVGEGEGRRVVILPRQD